MGAKLRTNQRPEASPAMTTLYSTAAVAHLLGVPRARVDELADTLGVGQRHSANRKARLFTMADVERDAGELSGAVNRPLLPGCADVHNAQLKARRQVVHDPKPAIAVQRQDGRWD